MDRSRLGALLVWPVLLALALGEVVLFVRLGDLEAAVLEVDVRERAPRRERPTEARPPADPPRPADPTSHLSGPPAAAAPLRSAVVDPPPASVPLAQVEDAVRRILEEREKGSPFKVGVQVLEDPVVVLERELKLSAAQKDQLQRFRKERLTAQSDLGRSELRKSHPDVWQEQARGVEEVYQARVRNLLDSAQQEKYDALRSSGRLWDPAPGSGGGVVYSVQQEK